MHDTIVHLSAHLYIIIAPTKMEFVLGLFQFPIYFWSRHLHIHIEWVEFFNKGKMQQSKARQVQCNEADWHRTCVITDRQRRQFPTFGSFHTSPRWRQASGQTIEERETMVGWRGLVEMERQLERGVGKDHVGEVGWMGSRPQLGSASA